jgi:hypothetical protein
MIIIWQIIGLASLITAVMLIVDNVRLTKERNALRKELHDNRGTIQKHSFAVYILKNALKFYADSKEARVDLASGQAIIDNGDVARQALERVKWV